ncbi:MAG: Lrp/AsnC ligand binding domain-containing protein [Chromatiales bacterium]|nr:Lrp/AsnC ligand binding domain-containing protein [Chromatiales bacterium]
MIYVGSVLCPGGLGAIGADLIHHEQSRFFAIRTRIRSPAPVITAIILINVERAKVNEVAERLADMPEISEVFSVSGNYDVVAVARVAYNDALAELVTHRLQKIEGIEQTNTMLAFKAYSRHDLEAMFSLGGSAD